MPVPAAGLGYIRFHLRNATDGILLESKRPENLAVSVPEPREIRALFKILISRGARRVRLMGEDPANRKDLVDVVTMLAGMSGISWVALSTGGTALNGRIDDLAKAGLRGVNFHLDTLRPDRFAGGGHDSEHAAVCQAIDACLDAGLTVKLNAVLERGWNLDEMNDFLMLTATRPISVRFVEWNVEQDRLPSPENFVPSWEAMAAIEHHLEPVEPSANSGPAMVFRIPGHEGSVGFIPNVTEHFCADCHRVGLTDAGEIVSCIFGRGLDVLRHLRSANGVSDAETFIDRVIRRKTSLAAKLAGWDAVPMLTASPTPPL